jgi:type VI secretion system protein ImpB
MNRLRPRLAFTVDKKLNGDDSQLAVELRFGSMDDFGPEEVARQVPPLGRLIAARQEMADLLRLARDRRGAGR